MKLKDVFVASWLKRNVKFACIIHFTHEFLPQMITGTHTNTRFVYLTSCDYAIRAICFNSLQDANVSK